VAKRGGFDLAGGGNRGGGGFGFTFYGADALQEALGGMGSELVWGNKGDLVPRRLAANREMRNAAKDIAARVLIPEMHRTAQLSRTKIAPAMSETARAKSDRLIMVQVGGVNPKGLRGFKRGVGSKRANGRTAANGRDASSQNYRTTLAWGSEFGPHPSNRFNRYGAPRNEGGYWVIPAVERVWDKAVDRWEEAFNRIVDRYTRRG
jgi:hypothetical protein